MKKNRMFIPLIMASFLLSGCPANPYEITHIDYGTYVDTSLRVINHAELDELISNKSSFVLAISPATQGCACWNTFKHILEDYIQKEHVVVYEINYNSFFTTSGQQMDTHGIEIHKNEETFTLFSKGKLVRQEIYNANNAMFKTSVDFKKYMDANSTKPNMYFVGLDHLEELRASDINTKAVVYFSRNNCPDCQYVDANFFKEYDFKEYRMYIVDCESIGVREYQVDEHGDPTSQLTPESAIAWQTFKDNYGLSSKYNETYGYNTGYVPTFQLVHGGVDNYYDGIECASVYFNDTVKAQDDHYVVSGSFYTNERKASLPYLEGIQTPVIKGAILTEEDMESVTYGELVFKTWSKKSASKYHDPLLKGFLDYALKKSTFEIK